jgi:hypothetical protein
VPTPEIAEALYVIEHVGTCICMSAAGPPLDPFAPSPLKEAFGPALLTRAAPRTR